MDEVEYSTFSTHRTSATAVFRGPIFLKQNTHAQKS